VKKSTSLGKPFYETAKFKKLRDRWYRKVARSGLEDIEILDHEGNVSSNMLLGVSRGDLRRNLYKKETEDYFRFARQHLWGIQGRRRRKIWELHADGYSVARIREAMAHWKRPPKTSEIRKVVAEERATMTLAWTEAIEEAWRGEEKP
jgi:hypothetical protein